MLGLAKKRQNNKHRQKRGLAMKETEERLLLRRVCASKLNLSSHSHFDHLKVIVSDNLLTDLRDDRNNNDNQFSV